MSKKTVNASLVYIVMGLIFLGVICIRTIGTPEIWTHLAQGRENAPISFVEPANSINTTWLYDKILHATWNIGGATAAILLNTICVLAAFGALLRVSKKWGGPLSQGFALLIAGHLIFQGIDVGPQSIMMLFIALFMAILSDAKKPAVLFGVLIPLQILWANMHGSFLFGPVIAMLAAIQASTSQSKTRKQVQSLSPGLLGGLAGALLVATLATPYLMRLHIYVLSNLMTPYSAYNISLFSDYFQTASNDPLLFFTLILGAGGLITLKKRLPMMLTTLAIFGAIMVVVRTGQTLILFSVLTFPFIVLSITAVGEQIASSLGGSIRKDSKALTTTTQVAFIILIVFSMIPIVSNCAYTRIGSASLFGFGVQEEQYAEGLEELFSHPDFPAPENTLNMPADGGYIAWAYNRKTFIDTRANIFPKDVLIGFNKMLHGDKDAYDKLSEAHRPEAIIINTLAPNSAEGIVHLLLRRQPVWKIVYFDGTTAVLLLNKPELKSLLQNEAWQKAGLTKLEAARKEYEVSVAKGCRAGNPAELIGAGKIYLALNRPEQSEAIFELLLQGEGSMPAAWTGLGASQLMLKKLEPALRSLTKAIELSPNSAQAWLNYALAHKYSGNKEEYEAASKKLEEVVKAQSAAAAEIEEKLGLNEEEEKPSPKKKTALPDIKID